MDLNVTGLANTTTELDMIISPRDGTLVCVAEHHGVHVCWGCFEPFDEDKSALKFTEIRTPGATVRCAVHRKCVDPKNRKVFSDGGQPTTRLQSIGEVARGLQLRKTVARAVNALGAAAADQVSKIIL